MTTNTEFLNFVAEDGPVTADQIYDFFWDLLFGQTNESIFIFTQNQIDAEIQNGNLKIFRENGDVFYEISISYQQHILCQDALKNLSDKH